MAEIKKVQKEKKSFSVEVPLKGCSGKYEKGVLTIKGEKGEVSKLLRYPKIFVKVDGDKVVVGCEDLGRREKRIINTYEAHVINMVRGVKEGFEYTLVVVYAKFPISVEVKGNKFILKNLLGEKVPRSYEIPDDVKVAISSKVITVTGFDKEKTGQVAASLEQLTRINHLDRRVIQDGVFITKKPLKVRD